MIPDHPGAEDFRKNSFCPHFHKALFGAQYFYLLNDTAADFSHEASPPVRRHPSLLNDVSHMDGKSLNNLTECFEKEILISYLKQYGTTTKAKKEIANQLKINLSTLYRKLYRYHIDDMKR